MSAAFRVSLLVDAPFEMNVDAADVVIQPLVHGVHEPPSIRMVVATRRVTLLKLREVLNEYFVCLLVLLGYGAAEFLHAPFLKAKMATAEETEGLEQHRVDCITPPHVQGSTEVFSHLEDHLVVLVDALDASGVIVAPLHVRHSHVIKTVAMANSGDASQSRSLIRTVEQVRQPDVIGVFRGAEKVSRKLKIVVLHSQVGQGLPLSNTSNYRSP